MPGYYINTIPQANGDNEVHRAGCLFMPRAALSHYLGEFSRCADAVEQARLFYRRANGCRHCSADCHR